MILNTVMQNLMSLNKDDRNRFFKMITENADILIKLLPASPLLQYIVNGNVNAGDNAIIQIYVNWKNGVN